MRVFCGSVHADLCLRDDVAFRAMHAIPRIDSPTENAIQRLSRDDRRRHD
jgi:hypothetical protein